MYDDSDNQPDQWHKDAAQQAQEKADEFRIHAQLAAVFEAVHKFDAALRTDFDPELARSIQRTMARLDKSKQPDSPILPPDSASDAADLLNLAAAKDLPTNDYHVYRRPGEVTITRWIYADDVDLFYQRLQAHFDAAKEGFLEEQRNEQAWKQQHDTTQFLDALANIKVDMAERYLRPLIRTHKLFVLSTQTADELDIRYLCDYIMERPIEELVGPASAPGENATEQDRAWFFRMFSLRGMKENVEQMCFFTYLQKSQDTFDLQ